jgi:UDP:flavonoid glycosyltransferase YjiC (YdhE family)
MKVLCIVFSPATGSFGSLTRIFALAREFSAKGHEVSFCASGYVSDLIEKKQYPVLRMPKPAMFGLPSLISGKIEHRSQNLKIPVRDGKSVGSVWFVYFLTGMLNRRYLRKLVQAQIEAINHFKPDLILTEMDPGAYLSARIADIPIVTTFAKVSLHGKGSFFWKKARSSINAILREYGHNGSIEPEDLLVGPNIFNIIPSIPALDGSEESANTLYIGNILEPVREESADRTRFSPDRHKRYVFVYLGTGSIPLKTAREVLPSVFNGMPNVECLVAAQSIDTEEQRGNVLFAPWIPAARILPQCDMVICHGGLNTITQAVEAGIPLLLFPGPIFERRYNSEMVMKNGAGMMGESHDFTPEWIHAQYERRHEFKIGIDRLRKEFQRFSGTESAVKRIISWKEGKK